MEKTKFIRVEYKNLEAGKEYIQMHPVMIKNRKDDRKEFPELQWVQEIPDREDEMLQMLERSKNEFKMFKSEFGQGSELIEEIESLIQSVKQTK